MLLTPHLCSQIAAHVPSRRRSDLRALLYTNKEFHAAVLPKVYSKVIFSNIAQASRFTYTVNHVGPHLASYIHTFGIALEGRGDKSAENADFWEGITNAMKKMKALENLVFNRLPSPSFTSSLAATEWPFKLRQIELQVIVDTNIAKFISDQARGGRLRIVQLYPGGNPSLSDKDKDKGIELPSADLLDASCSILPYIRAPALLYLQLIFDYRTAGGTMDNTNVAKTIPPFLVPPLLRSFSIVDLPAALSTRTLAHLVSSFSPALTNNLLHLSHFHLPEPYPPRSCERSSFLASISAFRRLRSLEVTLDAWDVEFLLPITRISTGAPLTSPPLLSLRKGDAHSTTLSKVDNNGFNTQTHISQATQRALIAELVTHCPTLRTVVLWYGQTKFKWVFFEDKIGVIVRGGEGDVDGTATTASAVAGSGDTGGANGIDRVSPRLNNSAIAGTWHFRVEAAEWPGYSNLWCLC